MTRDQLKKIMPYMTTPRADLYAEPLTKAMLEFEINLPHRQAAFIAQIAHESGELRYVLELASGEAYEGRMDLGNSVFGDGRKYKGRGFMQITGRANYKKCGQALGVDLEGYPERLEEPELACRSATWYWWNRDLNNLADQWRFATITKRINGGYNGMDERCMYWARALSVLNVHIP